MADEPTVPEAGAAAANQAAAPAPQPKPRHPNAPRVFEKMEVRLVRMGRVVATYRGDYGVFDARRAKVDLIGGRIAHGGLELAAGRLALDLPANRLAASGAVTLTEGGLKLETERLVSAPSLTAFQFGGQVVIHAKDKESARRLFDSGLV